MIISIGMQFFSISVIMSAIGVATVTHSPFYGR